MDNTKLVKELAFLQSSAGECERRLLKLKDKVRRLRAAGDRTGEAESALSHLQADYDGLLYNVEERLDQLAQFKSTQPHGVVPLQNARAN
jgi:hypothetical protein